MTQIKKLLSAVAISGLLSTSANAYLIDFIDMTDKNNLTPTSSAPIGNGFGESIWNPLNLTLADVTLSITGHADNDDDNVQFAYLDKNNAGLGVCKDKNSSATINKKYPGNGTNRCSDAADDNVTTGEYLIFDFDQAVKITGIWFNNNHDEGFAGTTTTGDFINIGTDKFFTSNLAKQGTNGGGYLNDALYSTEILLGAGDDLKIAFGNEQFYVSAMSFEVAVPEPSIMALFGLGLIGMGVSGYRRKMNS